ncbi:MAG: glycosyltransferase [Patescibacteria group bacterium]
MNSSPNSIATTRFVTATVSPLKVSIIIPVKTVSVFLLEALPHLQKLDWPSYEIIIVIDDKPKKTAWSKTRFIVSGPMGPAQKRDLGAKHAHGQILAFMDDDAFPVSGWLKQAVKHFERNRVAAVGGPGVTPLGVGFWEQASGWVSASPLGAGPHTYRFLPQKQRLVDDYPSMNLLIRKLDFIQVGGFDSHYYPGEDTKLCLDLIKLGRQIIYEPQAVVYHHRRPLWWPHLKQHGGFGLHRGFFARRLPQTSARPVYFMPSALVLVIACYLLGGLGWSFLKSLSQLGLLIYGGLLVVNSMWIGLSSKDTRLALVSVPAVFLTHFWYGIKFMQGFLLMYKLKQ